MSAAVPAETRSRLSAGGGGEAVDINLIEQQKENIQPLNTGRSATQLASLSSQSRSGLGVKLAGEHKRFQTQIAAIAHFEAEGSWPDGRDDLSAQDVAIWAEDPLDVHHQYARFVIGHYPAGASATSRLVPLLEQSTRSFLTDERYKNDPRYLRLWNLYAQKMDSPEDCYRFLFAKHIGERLASLYEEYALVLEAAGKRQQAEKIYQLGIARSAAPLDRLKKAFNKFRERMLVAPSIPDPAPTPAAPAQRSILAGAGMQGVSGKTVTANGAKLFDVFADSAAADGDKANEREGAQWEDLGTVKSRKRENDQEGSIWKGQTAPQTPGAVPGKPAPFKLEVFRDTPAAGPAAASTGATLSAPTTPSGKMAEAMANASAEADLLRANPFKNYSPADSTLAGVDPLAALPESAPTVPTASSSGSSSGKPKSSSSKKTKLSSSSSAATRGAGEKAPEFRTCDLEAVYPSPGVEFSFEELKANRAPRYREEVDSWSGWEHLAAWTEETARTGRTEYLIDPRTGWPVVHNPATGEPLYEFLRPAKAEEDKSVQETKDQPVEEAPGQLELEAVEPAPVAVLDSPVRAAPAEESVRSPEPTHPPSSAPIERASSPSPAPAPAPASPAPAQPEPVVAATASPLSSPVRAPAPAAALSPVGAAYAETGDSYAPLADSPVRQVSASYVDPRRAPSPTMNTLEAQHLVDNMFAKTLDFGALTSEFGTVAHRDDDDSEDDSDEDEDDNRAHWADLPPSQLDPAMSQMTQQSIPPTQDDNAPFVPFSQTASQLDDSMFATQLSQVDEEDEEERTAQQQHDQIQYQQQPQQLGMSLPEEDEEDENAGVVAPMRLFRDAALTSSAGPPATPAGFKPVMRAPLGAKPIGSFRPVVTAQPAGAPFAVFSDAPASAPASAQAFAEGDEFDEGDEDDSFEAPLAGGEFDEGDASFGDGFAMGRRERGVPSKYAPFVDAMTPITERTLEIGSATRNFAMQGGRPSLPLSSSQHSRRDSQFGAPAPVEEEEEEDEEDEDEDESSSNSSEDDHDDDNLALAEAFAHNAAQAHAQDDSSSNDSGSEDDSEDEPSTDEDDAAAESLQMPPPAQQQLLQQPMLSPPMQAEPEWRESAVSGSEQFDALQRLRLEEDQPRRSTLPGGDEHSFERSVNTTLPEGCTITGNQSGMRTDILIEDASTGPTQPPTADNDTASARDDESALKPELELDFGAGPIEAFSERVIAGLLASVAPPVFAHPLAHDRLKEVSNQLAQLQKEAEKREKARRKSYRDRTGSLSTEDAWELELDGQAWTVVEKLGQGGFGAVFRVVSQHALAPATGAVDDTFDLDAELAAEDEAEGGKKVAVKVEQPTNVWEWHVIQQLHARLSPRSLDSVLAARELFAYKDASYLFVDMCDQGSLLDAVNKAQEAGTAPPTAGHGQGLEEVLAVFFVVELLRLIEDFHEHGFVHGDLKIDNCLLRFEDVPGGAKHWANSYDRSGEGGWRSKGLKIIDFGRTIDRTLFPEGQRFLASFDADENDCAEMRAGESWTTEPDYYGLATIAYSLLFGGKMDTRQQGEDGRWVVATAFKRYHQGEMWTRLFDTLLNPGRQQEQGVERLRVRRMEMEDWLEVNGERNGKSLKALVRKMERWAYENVKR